MRLALVGLCAGCFTGAPAERAVDVAWVGRTRVEIVDRWGDPADVGRSEAHEVLHWTHDITHVTLPEGGAALAVHDAARGGGFDAAVAFKPGEIWHTTMEAAAQVDAGVIARVEGASLRWGPPNDANLH